MDHPQLDLVSLEDIQNELQQLGLDIEDKHVLERMKNMCLLFGISCEKLVEAWYSYQLKRKIRGEPSIAHLEQFEQNVLTKDYVKEHGLILGKGDDVIEPAVVPSKEAVTEDEMIFTDLEPKVEKIEAEENHDNRSSDEPKENVGNEVTEEKTVVESSGIKQVSCYLGDSLEEEAWKRTDTCELNISLSDPATVLDNNYKVLDLRLQDFGDFMDELISHFQDEVLEKCPQIGTFTDLSIESAAPAYFCGRIFKEIQGSRINSKSLMLEGNSSGSKRIRLHVDALSDFSFFPGQIIAVRGINGGDRGLQVMELLKPEVTIPPLPTTELAYKKTINIAMAAGPFGNESTISKLIDYFYQDQPHAIILMGPFVPSNDPDILEPKLTSPTFVNEFTKRILKVTTDSQIIVVPSPNDFFTLNIVPSVSSKLISSDRVHDMPNPCLVNVSGCIFGISTTDIVLDLLKEEYSKVSSSESGERMKRLHEHLLFQNSFYPLFPPGPDVNIEYSRYQHVRMPVRPHVLIIPSDTKHFCKSIYGCICVNSEKVSKRSLVRMKLAYPSDDFSGSIDNLASVEVFKL